MSISIVSGGGMSSGGGASTGASEVRASTALSGVGSPPGPDTDNPLESKWHAPKRSAKPIDACRRIAQQYTAALKRARRNRTMSDVRSEVDGPVLVVTIDRPARRNAVDRQTAEALSDAFRTFEHDPALAIAVLTGAAGTFCAGADLQALAQGTGNHVSPTGDGPMGPTRMRLSKPVIAAIEGYAVAGGIELALWCDLRVAARDAVLGVFCRRFGVPLIDLGTVRLPRLIGMSHALDLILTGRGVGGEEALRMGLVNRLVDHGQALEAARALAHELAALPQTCMRNDRLSAYEQWDLDLDAATTNELQHGMQAIVSGETAAGATRFKGGAGRHGG
jgi:enoyl-CoA hydratase